MRSSRASRRCSSRRTALARTKATESSSASGEPRQSARASPAVQQLQRAPGHALRPRGARSARSNSPWLDSDEVARSPRDDRFPPRAPCAAGRRAPGARWGRSRVLDRSRARRLAGHGRRPRSRAGAKRRASVRCLAPPSFSRRPTFFLNFQRAENLLFQGVSSSSSSGPSGPRVVLVLAVSALVCKDRSSGRERDKGGTSAPRPTPPPRRAGLLLTAAARALVSRRPGAGGADASRART